MRKLMTWVTMAAFCAYTWGCSFSTPTKVLREEIPSNTDKILDAVLLGGDLVVFDSDGGSAVTPGPWVAGTGENGDTIKVLLADIVELRTGRVPAVNVTDSGASRIAEVVLRNGLHFVCKDPGGRYDSSKQVVSWQLKDGTPFSLPLSRVRECRSALPPVMTRGELTADPTRTIAEITLSANRLLTFDAAGGRLQTAQNVIRGTTKAGKVVEIDIDDVLYVHVAHKTPGDEALTILTIAIGAVAVAGVIVLAASCPFVYSYDGTKYVLDAEPLGGAISQGIARTDYSRLNHLRPSDGKYRLSVRNPADETQCVDEMKLVVLDHPPGDQVFVDDAGRWVACRHVLPPLRVTDENGADVTKFFLADDGVMWQTKMPVDSSFLEGDCRHHLTITFPRPKGADSVKLLINAGTAMWGARMIAEMIKLRGSAADEWFRSVDSRGEEYANLYYFNMREELYLLKVNVREGHRWTQRALLRGGGPYISEDRWVTLDLRHVTGDTLTLQLNPPLGFWQFDRIGLVEDEVAAPDANELAAVLAREHNGGDIRDLLGAADGRCYMMPKTGDRADIEFAVPAAHNGSERLLYLKTTGWYKLHLPGNSPPQTDLMNVLWYQPGKIVEYSLLRYLEWRSDGPGKN